MKKLRSIFAIVLVFVICATALTGCVRDTRVAIPPKAASSNKITTDTDDSNNAANAEESTGTPNSIETPKSEKTEKSNETTKSKEPVKSKDNAKVDGSSDKADKKSKLIGDDWEVVITYDADGIVTNVVARNDDTFQKESYKGYEGGDYDTVVSELVAAIEDAGYYVDDIDYERSHVTIEISGYYDRDDDRYDDRYYWD